jgi:Putative Ig domain
MAGKYSAILATDYNIIQAKVEKVLGTGIGDFGYGQPVKSSQVLRRTNITKNQWNNLRTDLIKLRLHQTNTNYSSTLKQAGRVDPEDSTKEIPFIDTDYQIFSQLADDAINDRFDLPAGQGTREALVPTQQYSQPWNGTITQVVTVTFPSVDAARYFFNSGGKIEFSGNRTGGDISTKNTTWTSMLGQGANGMGVIQFGYNSTTCTGVGQPAAIGYYNLLETTTTDQVLFTKLPPAGPYSTAFYYIYGRSPVPNQIVFTITWVDGPELNSQDENVNGVLSSFVQVYRASSASDDNGDLVSVNIPKPPAITSGLAGGVPTPAPEIAIGPAQSSITQPQVGVAYTLAFGAIAGTSPYTWSSIGTLPPGLTLNPTTGVLSGVPTTAFNYLFFIVAQDADGYTGSAQYTLSVEVGVTPTITVTPVTLSTMQVGSAFNQVFSATGGTGPYTWSLIGGAPDGITLSTNQNGFPVLTGTPTAPQTYNFKVRATDNNSFFGEQTFIITVAPAPAITVNPPSPLSSASVGLAVTQNFTATGGTSPYTWSSSGTLPAGLSLAPSSGIISGTPSTAATYNFVIKATDSRGYFGERSYSQIITPAPTLSVTPTTLNMQVGVYYLQTLTAVGGTAPYTFTLASGSLPAGISLQGTGLAGTPTSTASASFTIRVSDANNYSGTTSYLVAPSPAPAFTTTIAPTNSSTVAGTYADTYRFSKTGTATFTVNCTSGSGQVRMTTASNSDPNSAYTYFGAGENSFGGEFDIANTGDIGLAKMIGDYFYASNSAWSKTETVAGVDKTVYNVTNSVWTQFLNNYGVWTNADGVSPVGTWISATYNVNIATTGSYTLRISSDNNMTVSVDGTQVLSINSYTSTTDTTVTLTAGLHTITCRAKNDGGPAGFASALYPQGNNTPVWTTRSTGQVTISRTKYGLFRKPDAQGLKSWFDFAKAQNIADPQNSQVFKNAFAAALDNGPKTAGGDWERSNTSNKTFVAGTGNGDFLDRPVSLTATCTPSTFSLSAGNSQIVTMNWTVQAGSSVNPWEFTAISSAGGTYLYTIYRT